MANLKVFCGQTDQETNRQGKTHMPQSINAGEYKHTHGYLPLNLSEMKIFRFFQTERVCRQQFQI